MKISEIKRLCENYSLKSLSSAEQRLLNEEDLLIEVNGEDEGEKLTHLMAAQWCLKNQEETGVDLKTSIRNYTEKVRKSIG